MPSFGKIRYRWAPTVRGDRESRAPISLLLRPEAAGRATSSCCAVSGAPARTGVRCVATPAARSSCSGRASPGRSRRRPEQCHGVLLLGGHGPRGEDQQPQPGPDRRPPGRGEMGASLLRTPRLQGGLDEIEDHPGHADADTLVADPGAAALGVATVELMRALLTSAAGVDAYSRPALAESLIRRVPAPAPSARSPAPGDSPAPATSRAASRRRAG